MTLPYYSSLVAGTPIIWAASGGSHLLTLTSVTNGSARQGAKSASLVDGVMGMPELLTVALQSATGAAPVTGRLIEVYLAESYSATAGDDNPAGLSGTDAALANPTQLLQQMSPAGALALSNAAGTGIQRGQRWVYRPILPYIIPVVYNDSGQTLSATAGNHLLTVIPWYRKISD